MLINFEGVDGVGKTTQINMLKQIYPDAITTKEPGGTELGMMIRQYLINNASKISQKAEILLFLADRAEHYEKVIKPNYDKLILSDRSFINEFGSYNSITGKYTKFKEDVSNDYIEKLNHEVYQRFTMSSLLLYEKNGVYLDYYRKLGLYED